MSYLRNTWYIAAWATEVVRGQMLRRQLLDEFYVLFRDPEGTARILVDRCPHRFAPLSMGSLLDGGAAIECPYHGLRFASSGQCIHNPHGPVPGVMNVPSRPLVERYSALWMWAGEAALADPALIPAFDFLDPARYAVATGLISIEGHYELETDNIMDLSHIEFVHPMFSSPGVSRGTYQSVQEGDTVWSKRFMAEDDLPPFLREAFGLREGEKADRWLNVRWNAPACMALWAGGVAAGRPANEGREVPGAHCFTPQTELVTHYFFASAFPRTLGPIAQQLADDSVAVALGEKGVFTNEDKPIIEAQAQNMQGREFWSMKPALLSIDAGAVRARRVLAKKIAAERNSDPAADNLETGQ